MIPVDYWHDNGNGTAWLLVPKCDGDHRVSVGCHKTYCDLDRPCGECGGDSGRWFRLGGSPCPDCIDGRHTFEIRVAHPFTDPQEQNFPHHHDKLRVSIVPGMVLPIVGALPEAPDYECIEVVVYPTKGRTTLLHFRDAGRMRSRFVDLPPAAAPGMWAVLVKVAS